MSRADELAAASISWFKLAWLAHHERIALTIPIRSWLEEPSHQVRTVGTSPAVAASGVALPRSFPGIRLTG
jgi:PIN domain nuclease of toxin-antitoxin system